MVKNLNWFNTTLLPKLSGYDIKFNTFKGGDFGDLERIEIEGNEKGVTIDFWSLGWISIHAYDYALDMEIMNVLTEPHEQIKIEDAFLRLENILISSK